MSRVLNTEGVAIDPAELEGLDWAKLFGNHNEQVCTNCQGWGTLSALPDRDRGSCLYCHGSGKQLCADSQHCPVCYPTEEMAYLLGVGEKFYTPESFIVEANTMGVSKRIPPNVPKNLELGKTRVFLCHKKGILIDTKVDECKECGGEGVIHRDVVRLQGEGGSLIKTLNCPKCKGKGEVRTDTYETAVFCSFVPQRIEMLVWESELTDEKRAELEKRGITPVPIPDGDKDHMPRKGK